MKLSEWILGGFLTLILAVFGLAALLFWFKPDATTAAGNSAAAPSAVTAAVQAAPEGTARAAYSIAQPTARQWARDAQLLNGRATWAVATDFAVDDASWSFVFYSPSRLATGLVSVVNGQATFISQKGAGRTPTLVQLDNWLIDSPVVIEQFMLTGGRAFVEDNGPSSLTLNFSADRELVWTSSLIHTESRQSFNRQIAADSAPTLAVAH